MNFPDKKYNVIHIDPPYPIQLISRKVRPNQKAMPYNVMTFEDIENLPIENLADDNCFIFCWTTHKWMPKTFSLLERWGFNYNCTITWDKGVGFTPMGFMWSTEFCLFGIKKGNKKRLKKLGEKTLIKEKSKEHSRKPNAIFSLIDKVCEGEKIDVFGRRLRHGWDVIGNDEKLQNQPLEAFSHQLINKELLLD